MAFLVFSKLVLISSFCEAFFESRLWKGFFDFSDVNLIELKKLRVIFSVD